MIRPEWSWQMFLIGLIIGTSVMLMRFIDQMSGYEAHVKGGEKDWCVRLGLERAVSAVGMILLAIHAMHLGLAYFHPIFLMLLLTVPMGRRIMKGLHDRQDDLRFIRPAPQIVKMVIFSELLIIISLTVHKRPAMDSMVVRLPRVISEYSRTALKPQRLHDSPFIGQPYSLLRSGITNSEAQRRICRNSPPSGAP